MPSATRLQRVVDSRAEHGLKAADQLCIHLRVVHTDNCHLPK